jgi:uncharacterized tellurite resistance protein B-like protein
MMEAQRIALPFPKTCATWTTEAHQLLSKGTRRWHTVLQTPILALQNLHQASGADATLFVGLHPWTDADGRPGTLISLYFATDARISKQHLSALGRPLEIAGQGWSDDGIHGAPDHAFPVVAMHKGELHYVWSDDDDDNPFVYEVSGTGLRARVEAVLFTKAVPGRFFEHAKHSRGRWAQPEDARIQHKEQLKMAFAYRVAERVVEADGVVDADELAFLKRTFQADQMEALWLDDPALRDTLARQAEVELADMLGYHEKLGLLSTFFGACYADGKVQVQELKVLKEAAGALGLDNADVVSYLRRLW